MTLQDIETKALQLSKPDRWQLVHCLLDSLRRDITQDEDQTQSVLENLNSIYSQESSDIDPALAQALLAALPHEDW